MRDYFSIATLQMLVCNLASLANDGIPVQECGVVALSARYEEGDVKTWGLEENNDVVQGGSTLESTPRGRLTDVNRG